MLTFNGKKFNANDFAKSLEDGVLEITKAEMGERFRSICHPRTREFPTVIVFGSSLGLQSGCCTWRRRGVSHAGQSKYDQERSLLVAFRNQRVE